MLDDIFPGDSHSKINLELFTYSIAALPPPLPPPPLSARVCTLQESWLRISFCFADEKKKKEKNSPAWSTHLLEGKNTQSWPLEIGRRRAVPALIRGTVNKTVRQRLL